MYIRKNNERRKFNLINFNMIQIFSIFELSETLSYTGIILKFVPIFIESIKSPRKYSIALVAIIFCHKFSFPCVDEFFASLTFWKMFSSRGKSERKINLFSELLRKKSFRRNASRMLYCFRPLGVIVESRNDSQISNTLIWGGSSWKIM